MYFPRRESHQIQAIFDALVEALKKIAPVTAALLGVAASVVCLAASMG